MRETKPSKRRQARLDALRARRWKNSNGFVPGMWELRWRDWSAFVWPGLGSTWTWRATGPKFHAQDGSSKSLRGARVRARAALKKFMSS